MLLSIRNYLRINRVSPPRPWRYSKRTSSSSPPSRSRPPSSRSRHGILEAGSSFRPLSTSRKQHVSLQEGFDRLVEGVDGLALAPAVALAFIDVVFVGDAASL